MSQQNDGMPVGPNTNAFAFFGASGEQNHRVVKIFTGMNAMRAAGLSDLVDPVVLRGHTAIVDSPPASP